MNFTPFSGQLAGTLPTATMHHFTSAKIAQNLTAAVTNGAQIGQVVGVLSGGEGGVHYLRPVEGGAGFQALPHPVTQQQVFTLPITVPGAKPGDPQQTLQIQVVNPNVTTLNSQVNMHQPKYQVAHIPIQTFQQGELGTVLTVAYAQDGSDGVQIIGNALPEGLQVVAALQPQDVQMLTTHVTNEEHLATASKSQEGEASAIPIQINTLVQPQPIINIEDNKKSTNNINNNNPIRIKQENSNEDDSVSTVEVLQHGGQWTIASANPEIAEYLCQLPGGAQLQHFLKFNNDPSSSKTVDVESKTNDDTSKEDNDIDETATQADENESETPIKTKKKKKYKKKPPKPKKPKPGQVLIATALDGTQLYCCPECHMAYPKKELLEQHLTTHKIERRYICGICGAGLKRREHLERHKLGHNPDRPFVCSVCLKGFKRKEHLNLHFVIHSGEKTEICQECGKGFYRKDHLRKHTRAHATRRAREEMVAQQQKHFQQQKQLYESDVSITSVNRSQGTSSTSTSISSSNNTTINNIQPEITIHVPLSGTSTSSVPIHISVPQHIVTMANSTNTTTTDSLTIKEEMEGMLMQ